ncbi:MAG: hypothetical protein OHK93_002117 [Ramalina farinacea]|uniref:Uncharacterized protein n=1 Tax=Ramalina farinacea TaxID=258253 RepID=A0AA43QRN4_9LECA|nr:hypothetical protein [Ramalina farinacea]
MPRILQLISSLTKKNRTSLRRVFERQDTDLDASIDRIEAFEGNCFVFWAVELKDRVFAEIYLQSWIQDCHRRRDFYEARFGISEAVDVQYRLVEQLSSPEYHGTPDMLYTETTSLVEMYRKLTNRCRSLHPLLQDPALFIVISDLSELETKLESNYAHSGVAVIRTLFTQLSRPWQTLAIADAICEKRCWAVLTYLGTGLDINQQMESGMSILHLAVERGSQNIVEMLIEKGADLLAINTFNGWSALHYATWGKHARILRTLLSTELNGVILVKDKNNETALDLARKRGVDDCIQTLQEAVARQNRQSFSDDLVRDRRVDDCIQPLQEAMTQPNRQSVCDDLAWERGVDECSQPLQEAMGRQNGHSEHDELRGLSNLDDYQAILGHFHTNLESIGRKATTWKSY